MRFRRLGQPGHVEAVEVPCFTHFPKATDFQKFIGPFANLRFEGNVAYIGPLDRHIAVSCRAGQWLVRDRFGNVSVWDEVFFRQTVVFHSRKVSSKCSK